MSEVMFHERIIPELLALRFNGLSFKTEPVDGFGMSFAVEIDDSKFTMRWNPMPSCGRLPPWLFFFVQSKRSAYPTAATLFGRMPPIIGFVMRFGM